MMSAEQLAQQPNGGKIASVWQLMGKSLFGLTAIASIGVALATDLYHRSYTTTSLIAATAAIMIAHAMG